MGSFLSRTILQIGFAHAFVAGDSMIIIQGWSLSAFAEAVANDMHVRWAIRRPQLLLDMPRIQEHWIAEHQAFTIEALNAAALCLGIPATEYSWPACRQAIAARLLPSLPMQPLPVPP